MKCSLEMEPVDPSTAVVWSATTSPGGDCESGESGATGESVRTLDARVIGCSRSRIGRHSMLRGTPCAGKVGNGDAWTRAKIGVVDLDGIAVGGIG